MTDQFNRRDFIKKTTAAGVGIALGTSALDARAREDLSGADWPRLPAKPLEKVRIGYVGVGGMGTAHVNNLLKIPGAEILAVCDILESHAERAQNLVVKAGQPKPEAYTRGEHDFRRMCERTDLDLIYTATPWEWHVPVCLEAMKTGKHAASEVPAAISIDDCWDLVEASEKTGRYCIMMENCNYDRVEMMVLNMVKKGILGELLHAECGYLHDLREVKHDLEGEGLWRRAHSMKRNGDLYPTHGLGPVAQCMDINRGNAFDYLVSLGTKTRGLHLYALAKYGVESPQAKEEFALNDIVTTLIRTKNGETIVLTHDTNNPRPYSRNIIVQGTRGLVRKYPDPKVFVESRSKNDDWEPAEGYLKEFDHPVWSELEEKSKGAGHGGMDFIEDYRLINALLTGAEPDMDVYDAAAISAVTELSARSIARDGKPMEFPDFTRGRWKQPRQLKVMEVKP